MTGSPPLGQWARGGSGISTLQGCEGCCFCSQAGSRGPSLPRCPGFRPRMGGGAPLLVAVHTAGSSGLRAALSPPHTRAGGPGEVRGSLSLRRAVVLGQGTRTCSSQDCRPRCPLFSCVRPTESLAQWPCAHARWEGHGGQPRRDEAFAGKPGPGTRCPGRAGASCAPASGRAAWKPPRHARSPGEEVFRSPELLPCSAVWPTAAS